MNATHLEAAVDQAHVRGGDVEVPLDLGDGTLHVRRCQRSRETGEGQHQDEYLQNTRATRHRARGKLTSPITCFSKLIKQ